MNKLKVFTLLGLINLLLFGYVRSNIEPLKDIITVLQTFYLNSSHSIEYSFFIIKYCGTGLRGFMINDEPKQAIPTVVCMNIVANKATQLNISSDIVSSPENDPDNKDERFTAIQDTATTGMISYLLIKDVDSIIPDLFQKYKAYFIKNELAKLNDRPI